MGMYEQLVAIASHRSEIGGFEFMTKPPTSDEVRGSGDLQSEICINRQFVGPFLANLQSGSEISKQIYTDPQYDVCPLVKIEPGCPIEKTELLQDLPALLSKLKEAEEELPPILSNFNHVESPLTKESFLEVSEFEGGMNTILGDPSSVEIYLSEPPTSLLLPPQTLVLPPEGITQPSLCYCQSQMVPFNTAMQVFEHVMRPPHVVFEGRVFTLQDEPDVPRVWLPLNDSSGLVMARAYEDFCLKDYGLISVPEVSHCRLTERDQFIVMATDWIWGALSNMEVVEIVASAPTRTKTARSLVEFVVETKEPQLEDEATDEKGARARMASFIECARNVLEKRVWDNKGNAEKFRLDLMKIAMTTLSYKILSQVLAVDTVMRLQEGGEEDKDAR